MEKKILIKALKLEKSFELYKNDATQQHLVFKKFEDVWGKMLANHFLSKYDNAESLIWALDSDNLKLFIEKF